MKGLEPEYYNSALMKKLDVLVQDGLGPVIARLLKDKIGDDWIDQLNQEFLEPVTHNTLRVKAGKPDWDFNRVMNSVVFYGDKAKHNTSRDEQKLANDLRHFRNNIAHAGYDDIGTRASIERTFEFLRKTEQLLDAFGVVAQLREVRELLAQYEKDLGAGMLAPQAPVTVETSSQPVSGEPGSAPATSGREPAKASGKNGRTHLIEGVVSGLAVLAVVADLAGVADFVGATQWLFGNSVDQAVLEASDDGMTALAGLTAEVEAYVTDEARCATLGQMVKDVTATDSTRLTAAAAKARTVASDCGSRFAASDARIAAVRQLAADLAEGSGTIDKLAEATVRLTSFDLARHQSAETRQALEDGNRAVALVDASRTRLSLLASEWTRFSADQTMSAQSLAQALGAITSGDERRATPVQGAAIAAASAYFAQPQVIAPVRYSAPEPTVIFADPDIGIGANPIIDTGIQNPTEDSFAIAPATQEAPNPIVVVK